MQYNFDCMRREYAEGMFPETNTLPKQKPQVFDNIIERRGTYSVKHDHASFGKPEYALPMWVADMDFTSPPCVTEAIITAARYGIFGYCDHNAEYFCAVQNWYKKRFNWDTERDWLVTNPGVGSALYISIRALTNPGDGVLIQQPVYYPFEESIKHNGRKLLINELAYNEGRYSINFDDFEEKTKEAKLFILCNPHNPVGRVWTHDELFRMGEICLRYGVNIVSDEIHQDFVYSGHKHLVFAGLDSRFADIAVTCTSPSKTFNLAGLLHANIFISNEKLRNKFRREYKNSGITLPGIMGLTACKAAYENGEDWLDELLCYLWGNMSLIKEFLKRNIPKIKLIQPEGTYLAWLDFSNLELPAQQLDELITHKAKLWLNNGAQFGMGGEGFQRMNAACPRSVLQDALERLKTAL